jgi:hypothetical protein
LAAERAVIGADRGGERIAVEVQSFLSPSPVADLEQALGQFIIYRSALARQQPDRPLFLVVDETCYDGILSEPVAHDPIADLGVRLLIFDPASRRVVRWKS